MHLLELKDLVKRGGIGHRGVIFDYKTMNMLEQSMLSSYASGEILSARQKANNGCPKGDVIGKRSFPKRGPKCREEKNDKGRNQNHVICSMWTVTYW